MPCAIGHMLDYNFTKYTYFSTIRIIRDFFVKKFCHLATKKRVASCIMDLFWKKALCGRKKES